MSRILEGFASTASYARDERRRCGCSGFPNSTSRPGAGADDFPVVLAAMRAAGRQLCEHAMASMKGLGARIVEIGTGGDPFHAPARRLYESLGCAQIPVAVYFKEL